MNANELNALGKEIVNGISAGLMQAVAAGAKQFQREMADAARGADADGLLEVAERIEQEKASLTLELQTATGLKAVALRQRLARLVTVEQQLCSQVEQATPQTLAIESKDARRHVKAQPRNDNGRFALAANGAGFGVNNSATE